MSTVVYRWYCLAQVEGTQGESIDQEWESYGPQANLACCLCLWIKFYCNRATFCHLCIVYGCFCARMTAHGPQSLKYLESVPCRNSWSLVCLEEKKAHTETVKPLQSLPDFADSLQSQIKSRNQQRTLEEWGSSEIEKWKHFETKRENVSGMRK